MASHEKTFYKKQLIIRSYCY